MGLSSLFGQQRTPTLLEVLLKALFIAVVSFGAPAGVFTALFPHAIFSLTASVACPRGSEMMFDEWQDGSGGTQFRSYCVDEANVESRDRTLLALGVILAGFFITCFYIALVVLLIQRARNRRKYGPG